MKKWGLLHYWCNTLKVERTQLQWHAKLMINNFLLYKLTTGNFVTNKTFFMFQTSHWLKFARCLCKAKSRCLSSMDFWRWTITISYDKQNISPSFTWNVPVRYFLARSWARRSNLPSWSHMFEETVGVFSKFLSLALSVSFNRPPTCKIMP